MDFAQAYEGLRRSYEQGVAMADAQWVSALYAEDAVLLAPGAEPLVGRDAIRAWEQGLMEAFSIEMSIEPVDREEWDGKGYGYGTFRVMLTPRAGGVPMEMTGHYLNVVQTRADGTLEILRHCWNSGQTIPAPPAG